LTCRAPVPPLDPLFDTWAAGRVIHVIHDTAFAPESFNPGKRTATSPKPPPKALPPWPKAFISALSSSSATMSG